jgi:creatinine amidohydrolase
MNEQTRQQHEADLQRQRALFEHSQERPLWADGRIERRLERLRPRQYVALRDEVPLMYLPVGTMEWHERHLPLGTDGFTAHDLAVLAAERTGGLVYPALYWGLDEYGTSASGAIRSGMDTAADLPLPGSIYRIGHETYERILMEAVAEIFRAGFKLVALITGHGARGQEHTIRKVALRYNQAAGYRCVLVHSSWTFGLEAIPWGGGHAGRLETALVMGLHPDLVDTAELPADGTPLVGAAESRAHPEHGPVTAELARTVTDTAVQRMAEFVMEGLHTLPADARPPLSARGL